MDVIHIDCGRGGWGHLAAIIDCHDREAIGCEFALRDRAREVERALEEACLANSVPCGLRARRQAYEATVV